MRWPPCREGPPWAPVLAAGPCAFQPHAGRESPVSSREPGLRRGGSLPWAPPMRKDGGRKETQGSVGGDLEGSSSALPDYFYNEKNKAKPLKQRARNYP